MSTESRFLKYIKKYFLKVGVRKIDTIEDILSQKLGEEKASSIMKEWDRILPPEDDSINRHKKGLDLAKKFPSEHTELYDLINSDFETSMLIGSYTDADIWQKCCLWLMEQQESIVTPAIDVGCGNGILTCFLASLKPEVQFLGIDRSEKSIAVAKQLKERLGVTNVEFAIATADEIDRKFSTVLSFRTIHENIGIKHTNYKFAPFSRQLELYGDLYQEYTNILSNLLNQGGSLLAVERNEFDTDFLSLLYDFNDLGMKFQLESAALLECVESNLEHKSLLTAFCLEKKGRVNDNELFEQWATLAFSEKERTRAQSDYYAEELGGKVMAGYDSFNEEGTQCGKFRILEAIEDSNAFFLYQANSKELVFDEYPMSRLQEAMELLESNKSRDIANGFRVVETN